jgi:hypothetical protein
MKNIFPVVFFLSGLLISMGSCKKAITPQGSDNSVILAYPTGNAYTTLNSGLNYFNNALLTFPLSDGTDTLLVSANLVGTNVPNAAGSDINITIGVDSSLVAAYNADTALQADTTHQVLTLMPASWYTIVNTTATIAAGQNQATFQVVFYPSRFNITQTGYLLPVSIVSSSAGSVNTNMNTVYFHIYKK